MLAAGEQQERLIEALLTLARSQRGLDRREPVDIAAVAAEAVCARQADAASQQLRITIGGIHADDGSCQASPVALGDARLAERLVANLVDNALRHNEPGGWITVRTGLRSGRAVLVVANSGPLIPADVVPRLFEPFQRLAPRRTSSGGDGRTATDGLGLGLSIVGAIAAAHGAELQAVALTSGGLEVQAHFPPRSFSAWA